MELKVELCMPRVALEFAESFLDKEMSVPHRAEDHSRVV